MTEQELLQFTELAKKYEAKDQNAIKKVVQDHLHPVFQDINDGGRTAANSDSKKKIDDAEKRATDEKTRADTLQTQLTELDGKAPDVAKLRAKFEEDTKKQREEHERVVTAKDQQITRERLSNTKQQLAMKFAEKGKIDLEYASTLLVNKQEIEERLQFDEAGRPRVLKAGSKDVHIVPASGKDALDHLVEELAPTVDAKWKTSGVRRGSKTSSEPTISGAQDEGGDGDGKDSFTRIREEVAERNKQEEKSRSAGSGIDRLRGAAH